MLLLNIFNQFIGVWAVGNIGHETGTLKWPLISAYLVPMVGNPLKSFIFDKWGIDIDESTSFAIMILAAAWSFDHSEKRWRPKNQKTPGILK